MTFAWSGHLGRTAPPPTAASRLIAPDDCCFKVPPNGYGTFTVHQLQINEDRLTLAVFHRVCLLVHARGAALEQWASLRCPMVAVAFACGPG